MARRVGGDYSREAIKLLFIFIYYFQIFPSEGGDYYFLREVINQGTAIIQGNTVS